MYDQKSIHVSLYSKCLEKLERKSHANQKKDQAAVHQSLEMKRSSLGSNLRILGVVPKRVSDRPSADTLYDKPKL